MLAQDRHRRIVAIVDERGTVTVDELTAELSASESTIRRDLDKLHAQGRLVRVHGGATSARNTELVSFDQSVAEKRDLHLAEKRRVAAYAATLVTPGDLVFVDAGTTTGELVELFSEHSATYVTNSIGHAKRLLARGFDVRILGGQVKPLTEAIVGEEAVQSLRPYNFTIGFWGTNGVNFHSGYTTPEFAEAMVKRTSLSRCSNPYVLCDASKLSQVSLVTFADFEDAVVICDTIPDERYTGQKNIVEVSEQ